jgi:hypothetical protein
MDEIKKLPLLKEFKRKAKERISYFEKLDPRFKKPICDLTIKTNSKILEILQNKCYDD